MLNKFRSFKMNAFKQLLEFIDTKLDILMENLVLIRKYLSYACNYIKPSFD